MKLFSRDLFYLVLLIMLVKVAISTRNGAPVPSATNVSEPALIAHSTSLLSSESALNSMSAENVMVPAPSADAPATNLAAAPAQASQPTEGITRTATPHQEAYNFSDLEENLMLQIDAAQKQVNALIPHVKDISEQAAHLRSLKQKLAHLRHAYQQSLAAPFFGPQAPIANESSTQQLLEKDLLKVVNKVGFIVHALGSKEQEFAPADSVVKALQTNHGLIEKMSS